MRCRSASGSAGFGGIGTAAPGALAAPADFFHEARRRLPVAGVFRRDFPKRGADDALVDRMAAVAGVRIEQPLHRIVAARGERVGRRRGRRLVAVVVGREVVKDDAISVVRHRRAALAHVLRLSAHSPRDSGVRRMCCSSWQILHLFSVSVEPGPEISGPSWADAPAQHNRNAYARELKPQPSLPRGACRSRSSRADSRTARSAARCRGRRPRAQGT